VDPVEIDLEGFEERLVVLPPPAGNYAYPQAVKGKLVFRRLPLKGADEEVPSPLLFWDLEEREEKKILDDVDGFEVSADGKTILVVKDEKWGIVEVKPDQKIETPLRTAELEMTVDPRAEWHQMFADAWRFERDFFYDPNMHGVDWDAMRKRYGSLIDDAVTRWDVNYILGELIAELGASHTYRGGGDVETERQRSVGLLGVNWKLQDGAWKIEEIVEGAPWDSEVRSPLRESGLDVDEGDYVLAVNGVPLDARQSPWAGFEGLAGESVELTVNDRPTIDGARQILVEMLDLRKDLRLRHLAWIESNRQKVDEATNGRVGYIYVRSTGVDGQTELVRQFMAQYTKDGLIIDERFNSGGQIPDRFIELLNRPPLAYWAVREGEAWRWPPVAHFGPKVMLINGWSGSGGDAFPDYFRRAGLGQLVGTRTWGGLIGISGNPRLIDGGIVTVPTFRMLSPEGEWFPEGHGVDPDVRVPEDPAALARGEDAQLLTAIAIIMETIETEGWQTPEMPAYERRIPGEN
ncbi:MAG: PDZ domain-containing protein, partial [Thermoanaerobaculia bacterium]|nr:PDZ domain-containing protein [Thermoanaerobaculia bacterium]